MSIRVRLTLLNAAVVAIVLAAFSAGVYGFVRGRMSAQLDAQLDRELHTVVELAEHELSALDELEAHGATPQFEVVAGVDVLYRSRGWKASGRVKSREVDAGGRRARVTVGVDDAPFESAMAALRAVLLSMIPVALALSLAGGYVVAGRMLSRVGAMAAKAREITADRLGVRLPVGDPADEFGRLATVVNETFARIEASFAQLRRFTADASHELRTPLTAIRSTGEVALQSPRDAAFYRDVIGSMLEEVDRLSRLVESLLTLTRAEGGTLEAKRERTDVAALARSAAETLRVLAEEKGQTLTIDAAAAAECLLDPAILRLAVLNVIDNAIKYTPARGTVRVGVARRSADVVIEIADTGPGIAEEHRAKVFERFYRIDPSRSREGGVGLGLAIAQWAAGINGGRIELETAVGKGSTFRIVLPGA